MAFKLIPAALVVGELTGSQIAQGAIATGNIEQGAVTAACLAAGIVCAGIVDGTLIEGAEFVAGEIFDYDGTPGAGNRPIFSLTAGTADPYDNTVPAGQALFGLPQLTYAPA